MMRLVSINMRTTASAVLLFSTALCGGAGPLIIGMVSDYLTPALGPEALSHALLSIGPMLACAALLFFLATRAYVAETIAHDAK